MSDFLDRKTNCTLTSPSGKKFTLNIDECEPSRRHIGEVKQNPSRSYGKKNNRRTYRTVNSSADTFQDLGVGGRDISLKVYVHGDDHDVQSKKLESALDEIGQSKLQLPYDGILIVQVLDYKCSRKFVQNISTTVFTINFHEVGSTVYPKVKTNNSQRSVASAQATMTDVTVDFAEAIEVVDDPAGFAEKLNNKLGTLTQTFGDVQNNTYSGILKDLVSGTIVNNPFVSATQIGKLINAGIASYYKGKSLLNLLNSITSTFSKDNFPSSDEYIINSYIANSAILGTIEQLPEAEIETRREAIEIAENLQDIYDDYREYQENVEINLPSDFIPVTNADINSVVQQASASLIESASDLKIEKTIILDKNSNIIDLAFKYYPDEFKSDCNSAVDYVVKTNKFEGDDLLLLKKGKEVLIYV